MACYYIDLLFGVLRAVSAVFRSVCTYIAFGKIGKSEEEYIDGPEVGVAMYFN